MKFLNLSSLISLKDVFLTVFGIALGVIFEIIRKRFYSRKRRKKFKIYEGIYIASAKDNPGKKQAIIKINLSKASDNYIEFSGTSLIASDYTGTILIEETALKSGTGFYYHRTQKLKRGEFIGFGTIGIILSSENQILVTQSFTRNNSTVQNPEVWRRVEGDDIGKTIDTLKRNYMQTLKDNKDNQFVLV